MHAHITTWWPELCALVCVCVDVWVRMARCVNVRRACRRASDSVWLMVGGVASVSEVVVKSRLTVCYLAQ